MPQEGRPTRTQDFIQGGLILILMVLLLAAGSMAVGYMVRAEISENKATLVHLDYEALLRVVDTDLRLSLERIKEASEARSGTNAQRIRLLEESVDNLENELARQKAEILLLNK
jgi:TolA-binding protein